MTVQVAFLGAGFIARYHAGQLARCATDHDLVAVWDPATHRRDRFAAAEGARAAASPEEAVAGADAVFVCTWTSEHLPMVALAAEAGAAVFCEKPLATDLATAREVARRCDDAGVVNMVGLVLRTSPAFGALRRLVADGRSGRVMNVVFRDDQFIPVQGMYRSSWRSDPRRAGAGTLLEHSIHDLDILEWCCGPVVSVSAVGGEFHGIAGIEDSVSAVLRFADGGSATLTSVWHDVLARPSQRRVEVFCERALYTLEGDGDGPVRWQLDDDEGCLDGPETTSWLAAAGAAPMVAEEAFVAAVAAGGPSPSPTLADAVRAHVLADALYDSMASGGVPVAVGNDG